METRKRNLLAGVAVAAVGTLALAGSLGFQYSIGSKLAELLPALDAHSGAVVMSYETSTRTSWTWNFKRASNGCWRQKTLTISEGQMLLAEASCEEGELVLSLKQGDKEETLALEGLDGPLVIPLADFEPGKLQLRLTAHGAKDVEFHVSLEDGQ